MRVLELSGALTPDAIRLHVWTRGRLDRGSVAFAGRVRSSDAGRRLRFRIAAEDLDLARILRLAPDAGVRDLRGRVSVRAKYDEAGQGDALRRSASGSGRARDLAFGARGATVLWARALDVSRFGLDLQARRVALAAVAVRGGEMWVRGAGAVPEPEAAAPAAPGWTAAMERLEAVELRVHYMDGETGEERLAVTVDEATAGPLVASDAGVPFSGVARIGSGGRLAVRGDVVPLPLAVRGHVEASAVALPPLAELGRLPVRLTSGVGSGAVDVRLADGRVEGSGAVTLADVKTVSPDPERPEDVLAFKEVRLEIREARSDPVHAVLTRLDVEWPYVLVDRTPTAIFPFSLASRTEPTPGDTPPATPFRIEHLNVLGGRIDFRDATLAPPYWRALANLTLDAQRIQVPGLRVGTLRASALVDEWSPLRVEGTVGARTRLVAEVERLALPPFNAYLAGAAPYTVSSGTLSGRSEITLDRSQLDVDNHVVLSRFGLAGGRDGDFIEREVGIPLTLALALMKDYRGNIELALPFGGDVAQPSFEMRSVVMQAIVRAVRGAILSPLNALGRVFLRDGRIERIDVDPIPFVAGERVLDDAGRQRVAQVARVLTAHPELDAQIAGLVAPADAARLKDEMALSRLVDAPDAEPLRAVLRARLAGQPPAALEDADARRLEALLAELPWPDRALQELARDRGAVATAALILEHRVDAERVATETPALPRPDTLAGAPGAAIELREP
jgi:hypothetical protein